MPVRPRPWWLLIVAACAAAAVTWWWRPPPPPTETPTTWTAAARVLAGDGRVGARDGLGREARFSEPFGVVAGADGTIYVADAGDSHRIRRIAPDGRVTTMAGGTRGFADGRGGEARFSTPSGLAIDAAGVLYVADTGNHAIRRLTPDGQVTTVAGDGVAGDRDGTAGQARFAGPAGIAVDASGHLIVADTYNDRVRSIGTDGQVRTLAGGAGAGYVDGPPSDARFDTPVGVAVHADGRILVADTGNGLLRAIAPDGEVTTVAAPVVGLQRPVAISMDRRGVLFVADDSGSVVALPPRADPFLVAGESPGFDEGAGSEARFRRPSGVTVLPHDGTAVARLVVADAGNALVRLLVPTGRREPAVSVLGQMTRPFASPTFEAPPRPRPAPAFDAAAFSLAPLMWPVAPLDGPHEVAGTFGEARGEAGQERFHAGLDIREVQGTPVRAVRDGIVASPVSTGAFETLNEYLRIGDVTYVHMRAGRAREATRRTSRLDAALVDRQRFAPIYDADGLLVRMRVMRGAAFRAGDVIGSVNPFNHVHLNVGWPGEEHNPLHFRLLQFADDIAPTIAASGVRLFDEAWQPLNPDRLVAAPARRRGRAARPRRLPPTEPVPVRGRVRIVVDAWDQANGNPSHRRLGLYTLGYDVLDERGDPVDRRGATRETLRFDRMRRDGDAPRQVYASGSGIPVYGASRTQFLYVVTTRYRDGIATSGVWDTTSLAPGPYTLRVMARDFSGNATWRDLRVIVAP